MYIYVNKRVYLPAAKGIIHNCSTFLPHPRPPKINLSSKTLSNLYIRVRQEFFFTENVFAFLCDKFSTNKWNIWGPGVWVDGDEGGHIDLLRKVTFVICSIVRVSLSSAILTKGTFKVVCNTNKIYFYTYPVFGGYNKILYFKFK